MFFFSLGLFLVAVKFLPWWGLALVAFLLGTMLKKSSASWGLQVALAGASAWMALAFLQDGRSLGVISQRLASLFHLPSPLLIFVIVALLGALTAGLPFQAGTRLRASSNV